MNLRKHFYLDSLRERMLRFQSSGFGDALRNAIDQRIAHIVEEPGTETEILTASVSVFSLLLFLPTLPIRPHPPLLSSFASFPIPYSFLILPLPPLPFSSTPSSALPAAPTPPPPSFLLSLRSLPFLLLLLFLLFLLVLRNDKFRTEEVELC